MAMLAPMLAAACMSNVLAAAPTDWANALLGTREIDRHCITDREGDQLLRHALARLLLSARAYHRVLKVSRTIADLSGAAELATAHVAEAIQYRRSLRET